MADGDDGFVPLPPLPGARAPRAAGELQPAPEADVIPWLAADAVPASAFRGKLVSLHNEILAFCDLVSPTAAQCAAREGVVAFLREQVGALWPDARMEVFGSTFTELFLPSSDIDAVVFGAAAERPLHALAEALLRTGLVEDMEVVDKARVPIIKFVHSASGVPVDVCFGQESGRQTGEFIRAQVQAMPALRPLTLLLKYFLAQRGLNETYTGGVGSFLLQLMIIASLQHHERLRRTVAASGTPANLGALLLGFLQLFGREFNYVTLGVSVRRGGFFFRKQARGREWTNPKRPALLAMENPMDRELDVGRNSFAVHNVRRALEHSLLRLVAGLRNPSASPSLLINLLRVDATLLERELPSSSLYTAPVPSPVVVVDSDSEVEVVEDPAFSDPWAKLAALTAANGPDVEELDPRAVSAKKRKAAKAAKRKKKKRRRSAAAASASASAPATQPPSAKSGKRKKRRVSSS